MTALLRTHGPVQERPAAHLFDAAALVSADYDDLVFTIETVRRERASTVPISIELDGAASSAILWVMDAREFSVDGEHFWFLRSRLSDVVSKEQWATGLNSDCVLVVPINTSTGQPEISCYLTDVVVQLPEP
jgi:hypothetical protein